jgi:hypothetical protein
LEKRHENSLKDILEAVAFSGHASVAKWRLSRWYGQSNFTVAIRRDLRERWKALTEEELDWDKAPLLRIAEVMGDVVLINHSNFFPDKE